MAAIIESPTNQIQTSTVLIPDSFPTMECSGECSARQWSSDPKGALGAHKSKTGVWTEVLEVRDLGRPNQTPNRLQPVIESLTQ